MSEVRFLKLKEVINKTSISRASIYRLMDNGDFPVSFQVTSRSVAWKSDEIQEWILSRPRAIGINRMEVV